MDAIFHKFQNGFYGNIDLCFLWYLCSYLGFPWSSAGKKFTCNAGDPSLIPGS